MATATAVNSSSSISKVICCTTCGSSLQEQNSAPIAKAVPEPAEKSDGLPASTIPTDSSSTTTTTQPSKDSESELQQQQSNANSTKPKEYLFGLSDFDPKFMVDPIKFSTAVTYFLPRGTTPEIQDAIACYQLPFCPECIDTIDRICTIENEIDNLYQLMESLISFFKFRVQLAFNSDNGISQASTLDPPPAPENEGQAEIGQTQQTSTSTTAVDDCILKMRASIIGLKTWNGVDLNPVRPSPSPKFTPSKMVKFRIPAKSNKTGGASNKYKQKQKQPSKIRTTVISPQLMNKKRQYRESVIKKIRTSGIGEGDGDGEALQVPGEDDEEDIGDEGMNVNVKVKGSNMSKRRTTTMHYEYLAISSDSNSSVDLNTPRPAPIQTTGDEAGGDKEANTNPDDPDNPEGEGVDIKFAIRKSSRLESCPPKRRKNMKYSGEEYETNLSDIVSEDDMELQEGEEGEVLGEEEESEDKDWDENDEMEFEYVEGEGLEEEEDDYMDDDDDDDEVESGSDGELGFPHIVDDVEGDGDNENEDHEVDYMDLNDKVARYKRFRELKLKREELIKSVKAKKPKRIIQKKSAVTDVGGGTFEYKNFKIIKMEEEDKFQCGTCNKIFKARANVIAHINLKHLEQNQDQKVGGGPGGAGGVNRNKSSRPPKRKTDRRQRQVTQLGPGVFQFEGLSFSLREDGRYQCGTCPNTLKTRDSALVHIKQRHLGEGLGKFLCFQCGKSFDRDVYLKLHEVSHSANKKLHQCSTCGKTFTQISNLYNHRKIHTGELNHHCTFENCGKKFLTRKQLTVHMKRHLGDRPYECDLCPKKFVRSSELVIHMRSHSEERPYECRLCESKFFIKYRLNRHLKKVHHIDEPVIIVERGGDAPIRIISSTSLQPSAGGTATGAGHISGAPGPSTHVPVNMALDPQNPLHHFLSLTDLF